MLKKLLLAMAMTMTLIGIAAAQVDVNMADQAALERITGIGPAMSKSILDERKKGGNFKNWSDLEQRVKGVGSASAKKLSQAGLTVNGQTRDEQFVKASTAQDKTEPKAPARK